MTQTPTLSPPTARANGHVVELDGVPTYYEDTGAGDPVIWLHGGFCPAETLDELVGGLSDAYRVLVPERWGHGRTPDRPGPYTYEAQASHTIAFIEALGLESVRLVGWSDGALIALLVAMRRPGLVRKLVFLEQFVTQETARPEYHELTKLPPTEMVPPFLVELYGALSPDGPDHLPVVVDKLHQLWTAPTGIDLADLAHVTVPTLVLVGDDGTMLLDDAVATYRSFPDAQLAVVPGTSHGLPLEKPHVVNQLCRDFFADDQVPKLLGFPTDD